MDNGLGDLTVLEHRLVCSLLVDHIDSSQQLVLVKFRLDRQLVETYQHPLHLLLAYGVLEGVECVFLFKMVETRSTFIVLVITSAIDVDGM